MAALLGLPKLLSIGTPTLRLGMLCGVDTGKRIRALRVARGLKQKDLARAIGIAAPSLSELETGKSKEPSGSVLAALCRVLHTNGEWLLTGKGEAGAYFTLDGDQAEMQAIWDQLPPQGQSALLATARGLRDAYVTAPSTANPYPKRRTPTQL
jgi:transcriptional regulator with XRE-family HTH domain